MDMRAMKAVGVGVVMAALAVASIAAQQFPAPAGWKWVTDQTVKIGSTLDLAEGTWLFGTMAPGWHITTRPGVTLFEPTYNARGRFSLESEVFLFPGQSAEGFGLFAGGRDLESSGSYVAFLIRRDGSAAIEVVDKGQRTLRQPWTKAAVILPGNAAGDAIKNALRVDAEASTISFKVNGTQVAEIPRDGAQLDGIVGLRVGADLNLHVTNLDVTHRLALPPRPKPVK
jgi:hypothetical protein